MPFDFRDVKPGDPVRASEWNDLGHAVRDNMRISGGPGVYARNGGNGLEISVSQPDEMDFQITGGPDSNGGYDWVLVTHSSAGDGTWVQTAITGGSDTGDPVYPRQHGLPKPTGRVLVLIPPLSRSGNYLTIGQAWLSVGLGNHLPAGDTVYHAVRADGDSQWMFDALAPELSTTSDAFVYVCCHSSSSSSSTSQHECKEACSHCTTKGGCVMHFDVNVCQWDYTSPEPSCVEMSGFYSLFHQSGCTWVATTAIAAGCNVLPAGTPFSGVTATLSYAGGWQLVVMDAAGHSVTFIPGSFNCDSPAGADLVYGGDTLCFKTFPPLAGATFEGVG
jgi:hypothetical protein